MLLAGLYAEGETIVREPITTRDHTEIALHELGADIVLEPRVARVKGGAKLQGKMLVTPVPGGYFFGCLFPGRGVDYARE